MRTPEEIKKGLECCMPGWAVNHWKSCSSECPYITLSASCIGQLTYDALAYIQRLEMMAKPNEQIRWERDVAIDQLKQLGVGFGEKIELLAKDINVPRWISVEERLPENEKPVLIATKWSLMGMRGMAVSCGFHTDGKTFTGDSDYNWTDGNVDLIYDEDEDEYIVPECWWESVRYSDEFSAVDEPVLYWMPLPEPPKEKT